LSARVDLTLATNSTDSAAPKFRPEVARIFLRKRKLVRSCAKRADDAVERVTLS
jgi:hypothetical protein